MKSNMAVQISDEELDEMVRDFCSVVPKSKSEVRRRINEYAVKAYEAGVRNIERLETKTQCNDCLTIFTGMGSMQCPKCEGTMHEIVPPPSEDWRVEFDKKFYEGERNSVYCKEHNIFATPHEIKDFITVRIEEAETKIIRTANEAFAEEIRTVRKAEREELVKKLKGMKGHNKCLVFPECSDKPCIKCDWFETINNTLDDIISELALIKDE